MSLSPQKGGEKEKNENSRSREWIPPFEYARHSRAPRFRFNERVEGYGLNPKWVKGF
ncbi:MAG: hypothetical protein DDT18_01817 [Actinobacteria bacterium]|nr:hypothetical protein [Actinomycetota bacterium]